MNITPRRHELQFGERLAWTPPAGTAEYYVWGKAAGDAAPRWEQLRGYRIAPPTELPITGRDTDFTLAADGVAAPWPMLIAAFDGYDPAIAQITAQDADGRLIAIDRYSLPMPNSTDAETIAAQERALLVKLLETRAAVASSAHSKVASEGWDYERMDLAALDRRVAEVRARIAWFEQAAAGNVMPRVELW